MNPETLPNMDKSFKFHVTIVIGGVNGKRPQLNYQTKLGPYLNTILIPMEILLILYQLEMLRRAAPGYSDWYPKIKQRDQHPSDAETFATKF